MVYYVDRFIHYNKNSQPVISGWLSGLLPVHDFQNEQMSLTLADGIQDVSDAVHQISVGADDPWNISVVDVNFEDSARAIFSCEDRDAIGVVHHFPDEPHQDIFEIVSIPIFVVVHGL